MNITCPTWIGRSLGLIFLVIPAPATLRAAEAPRNGGAQIVFMIGEPEYRTDETLPEYFQSELAPLGYQAKFIVAARDGAKQHDFDGLESALSQADLLVLSVRRRAPTPSQLQSVREYLNSGRPLVAIRTASHSFDTRGDSPPGHEQWQGFDETVLGGKYSGHYGDERIRVRVAEEAKDDPLLRGVTSWESSKLYQCELQSADARLLLTGERPNGEQQPVAWTNRFGTGSARILYTSLGIESDFENPAFRRFLRNAIEWALGHGEKNERNNR
jgi:type 1 glutamine amidotransferase